MLLQVSPTLWVNADKINMLRLDLSSPTEPSGFFVLGKKDEIYPLTTTEYNTLSRALEMFCKGKIIGE
jgi:hypothetical protein